MADDALTPADRADAPTAGGRLDSWKEIAAYLKRDVTTVRRWEKREGLPVHRHLHERRESVYAYTAEIDRWWHGRRNHFSGNGAVHRASRVSLLWTAAATILAALLVLTVISRALSRRMTSHDETEVRFSLSPPDESSFGTVSLSPDGRRIAFTASGPDGRSIIWIRPLDSVDVRPLSGTEGATFPFWAPDGRRLGFFAGQKLRTVSLAGGSAHMLADAPRGRGGTWSQQDVIVFAPDREGPLFKVQASGGAATPVTTIDRPGERGHVWPQFLPDGNHFLYLADSAISEHHNLFSGALDNTKRTELMHLVSNAEYVPSGYLLFARDRQLVAQPFDARRLQLHGDPVMLVDQVRQQSGLDHKGDFSVSNTGVLIYRGNGGAETRLVWRDRSGRQQVLTERPAMYCEPTMSPDEERIAVDIFDPQPSETSGFGVARITSDIWVMGRSSDVSSRFTFEPAADFDPVWSPDGTRIAFSSARRGVLDLYQKSVDGDGDDELLLASSDAKHLQAWSPDGRYLLYGIFDRTTRGDLWLLPIAGDRTPIALLQTPASEEQAQISPDGRWFAYTSDESGRSEVYVRSFPKPARKWQISTNGGGDGRWRPDGKELYYIADDRHLMAVAVKTGASFETGPAVPLFDTGMGPHWGEARNHYDVSRDGQRFLFIRPLEDDRTSPFTIVVNGPLGVRARGWF